MALLSTDDRARIWRAIQRAWSDAREACNFQKADLSAAIDATDQWIENNAASFNTALPQPFRNQATPTQKTLLFCYVALKRAGRSTGQED